jgi:uncharacterized protein YndB with AHSA1/START domain
MTTQENAAMTTADVTPASDRELVLTRLINAPRDKVFKAWTKPELLKQWFAPSPWTTPSAELDVRPGGASVITMRSPEGKDFPNAGVYLEVVENERLVFTDAYTKAWQPSEKPFKPLCPSQRDVDRKASRMLRSRSMHDVRPRARHPRLPA